MSSVPHVPMSPCPHVIMSPCHHVPMLSCSHALMSSCPHILMSPCSHVPMCPYSHVLKYPCPRVPFSSFVNLWIWVSNQLKSRVSSEPFLKQQVSLQGLLETWAAAAAVSLLWWRTDWRQKRVLVVAVDAECVTHALHYIKCSAGNSLVLSVLLNSTGVVSTKVEEKF